MDVRVYVCVCRRSRCSRFGGGHEQDLRVLQRRSGVRVLLMVVVVVVVFRWLAVTWPLCVCTFRANIRVRFRSKYTEDVEAERVRVVED